MKFKAKITGSTTDDGNTKNTKIAVPLKYLSNFSRTLEMPLTNREISLILIWSAAGKTKFEITDKQLYVPIVILSIYQDNAKLLEQVKSDFKRTISW